jgi:WD40 repeat protein
MTLAVRHRLGGSSGAVQAVEFSHDGTMVAVGADDGTVTIWEVVDGTRRAEMPGGGAGVSDLAFSADDKIVYAAADRLRAWDLHGGRRLVRSLVEQVRRRDFSSRVVPAPGGEALAYFQSAAPGDRHSVIQFRDVATGRLGQRIETGHDNLAAAWRPPDAGQFAAADVDGFVRVWNWRDGELVTERKLAQGPIAGIAYRDGGRRMVVAERSGSLIQVDADTLAPVGDRIPVGGVVQDVVAIPDATTVLVLLSGNAYALVDLTDGTVVDIELAVDPATVGVSPDGSRLAVGGARGHVGVADLETGEWVRPPSDGHEGWVQRVAYSPDGRVLASAGNDGQVKVWDGRNGEPLGTITPGSPDVWATVEFLPDGHTIIVGTRDGAVYTWDTRVEHWIDFACRVTGRSLTGVEWRDAFGERDYRETCP